VPYIAVDKQRDFQAVEAFLSTADIATSGDLNYLLTITAVAYLRQHGTRYATMNDIVGALEGAKLEFVRRVVSPYECQKAFDVGQQIDSWERTGDPYDRKGNGQIG
jgi:hypothetical protein